MSFEFSILPAVPGRVQLRERQKSANVNKCHLKSKEIDLQLKDVDLSRGNDRVIEFCVFFVALYNFSSIFIATTFSETIFDSWWRMADRRLRSGSGLKKGTVFFRAGMS